MHARAHLRSAIACAQFIRFRAQSLRTDDSVPPLQPAPPSAHLKCAFALRIHTLGQFSCFDLERYKSRHVPYVVGDAAVPMMRVVVVVVAVLPHTHTHSVLSHTLRCVPVSASTTLSFTPKSWRIASVCARVEQRTHPTHTRKHSHCGAQSHTTGRPGGSPVWARALTRTHFAIATQLTFCAQYLHAHISRNRYRLHIIRLGCALIAHTRASARCVLSTVTSI